MALYGHIVTGGSSPLESLEVVVKKLLEEAPLHVLI